MWTVKTFHAMKYLDPKADLTFKKVFGTHPDLVISLINALLPLKDDEQVESVEYLPAEMIPENPLRKDSIVDVRCKDVRGRQFVVEMQMMWTTAFKQRVLFNASKAYVSQAEEGHHYKELHPVYSLNLVNDIFEPDVADFCHNYNIVHDRYSNKRIEGLHFTFIELPKFTPHTMLEKRMAVLWLRFLTEIDERTTEVPAELLENPETNKALREVRKSAFTDAELRAYDKFWDIVSRERTLIEGKYQEGNEHGYERGHAEGIEEGRKEGIKEGIAQEKRDNARKMKLAGISVDTITEITGLGVDEIALL